MQSEKMKETLFKLKNKFEELRKVAEEKQKAIIEFDYDKLDNVVKVESAIVDEISDIKKIFSSGLGDRESNFIVVDDPELERLKEELKRKANEVRKLNIENRYLLGHSIAFVKKLMGLFQVDTEPSGESSKVNKRV